MGASRYASIIGYLGPIMQHKRPGSPLSRRKIIAGLFVLCLVAFLFALREPGGPDSLPILTSSDFPIAISRDGRTIATASGASLGMINVCDLDRERTRFIPPPNLSPHPSGVDLYRASCYGMAISPDGRTIVNGGERPSTYMPGGATLNSWDIATGKHLKTFAIGQVKGPAVVFSPDGRVIATGGANNNVCLWDAETGKLTGQLAGHGSLVAAVAFSPDGRYLASCSMPSESRVTVWDLPTRKPMWSISCPGGTQWLTSLAFSPDGRQLAVGTATRSACVLNASNGQLMRTLTVPDPDMRPTGVVGFAKDVKAALTGRSAGVNVYSWKLPQLRQVAYSPDGSHLVTAGTGSVILWSTATWRQTQVLDASMPAAFFPDGKRIATASPLDKSGPSQILVWNTP
jgi:WD40 repeat protein